jgi:hypothetical protein
MRQQLIMRALKAEPAYWFEITVFGVFVKYPICTVLVYYRCEVPSLAHAHVFLILGSPLNTDTEDRCDSLSEGVASNPSGTCWPPRLSTLQH